MLIELCKFLKNSKHNFDEHGLHVITTTQTTHLCTWESRCTYIDINKSHFLDMSEGPLIDLSESTLSIN